MEPTTLLLVASFLVAPPLTKRMVTEGTAEYSPFTTMVDTTRTVQATTTHRATEMLATQSSAKDLSPAEHQIAEYAHLVDDWDGEGARAPSMETILGASLIARYVPFQFPAKAMVSASGSISLYWDLPAGYAELGVDEQQGCYFFSRAANGHETFEEGLSVADVASREWLRQHLETLDPATA